ncbi:hypothetical protein [Paenibacillus crassostreae]|uniref:Uncharacterized protein n=1 Tax=Paenibacillus crassostreae TaxID=1763538 RepID=A0A167EI42_9BACL|nr:hypothetical protein [Paenibacillus crassostreae]AOZ94883.1 hypothetical protein LPB68_21715 [Paenibacillus crassostreae]OAB75566.1 hypothetical protein PNBC_08005 [Paenibacillus crassostreae]
MDARDHLNNNLIEIIEELASKRRKSILESERSTNQNNQKVVPTTPNLGDRTINSAEKDNETIQNPNSLRSLLAARHNLESLRARLNKYPEKNKIELEKLDKVEVKLNSSINKTRKREVALAIDTLKREPRRYVLKLAESKIQIEALKKKFELNPRFYKMHIEKLEKFEKSLDKRIDQSQVKTLRSAINNIQKNPQKYRHEIERYDEMEKTLNKGLSQNNLHHDKQKDKGNDHNKKQEKTRNDLELSH